MINKRVMALLLFAMLCVCSACGPANNDSNVDEMENGGEMEHDESDGAHDHDEHHHEGDVERIMNEGATIQIVSPQTGNVFSVGEQVVIEVEVENFELGVEGSHWHVYVDGSSWGMVLGGNLDQPLAGLAPGHHTIEAFLANGDHEELMEGDKILIMVEE